MLLANIIVPFGINGTFSYLADEFPEIKLGNIVAIQFKNRNTIGLVLNLTNIQDDNQKVTKSIQKIHNIKPLNEQLLEFIKSVSNYNLIPPGIVFKMIFNEKFLNIRKRPFKYENFEIDISKIKLNNLSEEQKNVFQEILQLMSLDNKPILLEGATGSGKTEIYFHLFKKILEQDKKSQMLFLLPEIALTSHFIDRFNSQFQTKDVVIWHSEVTSSYKNAIWNGINYGKIRIVIGARSALFLPFNNLKLIVVDEEHDNSYKQTDNGCYNGRDMAVLRAKIENCKIILGSATPSIESLVNSDNKKYHHIFLKSRFGKSIEPDIELVDLKKEKLKKDRYISQKLKETIEEILDKKQQVLLYMNRRGYAPIALCSECGYRFICPQCSVALTVHKDNNTLLCHQCGYRTKNVDICPNCSIENSIIFFGPGVEKIESEINQLFPNKKTIIITSDTVQSNKKIKEVTRKISNGEVDIIIGTQIITKGYDFPNLNLIGVLDADASLFGANFRSTERTYQLLTQVVGRAGRRETKGKAIIQTYTPDNIIIQAMKNNNKQQLIEFEKENRKFAELPPYGKIAMIILSGQNEMMVYNKAKEIIRNMPSNDDNIEIFGPTQSSPYKVGNNFRIRILVKTKLNINIQKLIVSALKNTKFQSNIRIKIDINPYNII